VNERLGHGRVAMTLDVYAHVLLLERRHRAEVVEGSDGVPLIARTCASSSGSACEANFSRVATSTPS
jgi:hypothetical protein